MVDIIRLLPDSLANQIAAGEVVQRPASVVKELMENSIDAGATQITLIVGDAGKGLIRVVDNGKGMTETDARLCLERHATSKIKASNDLFAIRTMGFRGEALASIAAVSQMELKTRLQGVELGTVINIGASELVSQEPGACEEGTSITVKNLFYNVPARRNFLKSNGVEMKHIVEEFQRLSLAFPEVGFSMFQEDEETHRLVPGKLSQRIVGLFGKNYSAQLAACSIDADFVKIKGYVGRPEFAKKTRGEQFLFVNNRYIKSHYLNHAVVKAYEGMMAEGYFPFYALFIDIGPEHIDVNVHPTKTEIKFDDERTVYSIVRSAVKQALGMHNIGPSLDFTADINLMDNLGKNPPNKEAGYSQFKAIDSKRDRDLQHWEKLYDENLRQRGEEVGRIIDREGSSEQVSKVFESSAHSVHTPKSGGAPVMQAMGDYLLTNVKSGLMIVDRKAAVERLAYERFLERSRKNKSLSQQCLFPATLELSDTDMALVVDIEEELKGLGFDFEVFGKRAIVIKGIPADIVDENEKDLFEGVLEQYKHSKDTLDLGCREKIIRAMARRTASRAPKPLTTVEMEEVVSGLFACENPNNAPDGRPTFKILERTTIEGLFR